MIGECVLFLIRLELRLPHCLHRLGEQLLGVHLGELVHLVLGQELAQVAGLQRYSCYNTSNRQ